MAPVQSLSNYPFGAADDINVGLGRFEGKIVVHCIIADHKEWSKVKAAEIWDWVLHKSLLSLQSML